MNYAKVLCNRINPTIVCSSYSIFQMRLGQGVPSPPVGKLRSCSNDLVTKQAVTDSPNWIPRKAILISHLS
ncbi:MAG: hypothetical protein ACOYME_11945, partial [Prochlorotrichaceae cyanobacterium]